MDPAVTVPVTAIVTAYDRIDQVLNTLRVISECRPVPSEVLVHVDGGRRDCAAAIRQAFPAVGVIESDTRVGPGGGRNKLLAAASHDIVTSFDDDSYPIDADYFGRVVEVLDRFPDAWVVDARVFHPHELIEPAADVSHWVADFSGGGCAYRRGRFLQSGGYLPLATAYGMEEVDASLRIHALGGRVVRSARLRVFHNTDLARHAHPEVTAASIINIALLAYLRYPATMWAIGVAQCLNRIRWLIGHGRRRGVLQGLAGIPRTLSMYRHERRPLSYDAVRSYLSLRRHPHAA